MEQTLMHAERMNDERILQMGRRNLAAAAEDLAEEFSTSTAEVRQLLSSETDDLARNAKVKEFVPILALKRVKLVLRQNKAQGQSGGKQGRRGHLKDRRPRHMRRAA